MIYTGYVYALNFGDMVKVGYSQDIKTRKAALQCTTKRKIIDEFSLAAPIEVEQLAHKELARYRIRGEYYDCQFEIACSIIKKCAKKVVGFSVAPIPRKVHFTMILSAEMAQKLDFIRLIYGRSRIKEIEWACKEYIRNFEEENGEIDIAQNS